MADSSGHKEGAVIIDDEIAELRKKRLEFLKAKERENQLALAAGGGVLRDIDEPQFLPIVTNAKWAMILARKYPAIAFLKMDVEKCQFFVNKLKIRVLPALLFFHNGVNTSRCVGFEEFGNKDDFETVAVEERMEKEGMIMLDEPLLTSSSTSSHPSHASGSSSSASHSTSISTRQSEYEEMRRKMMSEEDDDLFG